jgi:hypothetical protein
MAVIIPTNYQVSAPFPIDTRMGVFTSVSNANTSIPSIYRYQGLTVIIASGGVAYDYWYKDGIANGNLVLKTLGSTISAGNLMSTTSDVISFVGGTVSGGSVNVDVRASNEFRFRGNDAVTPTLTLAGTASNAWAYLRFSPNGTGASYIDMTANTLFFSNNGTVNTRFNSTGNWAFYNNVTIGSSSNPIAKLDVYASGDSTAFRVWNGTSSTILSLDARGISPNFFDISPSYTNTEAEVLRQTTINLAGGNTQFTLNKTTIVPASDFLGASNSINRLQVYEVPQNTSNQSYVSPIYSTIGGNGVFEVTAQNTVNGSSEYPSQTYLKLTALATGTTGSNKPQIFLNAGTSNSFLSFIQPTLGATVQSSYSLTLQAFASISDVGVGTTSYGSLTIASATRGVSIQPTASTGNVSSWNLNWTGINSGVNHRMVSRNNVTSSGVQNLLFVPSVGGTATQPTTTSANRILHLLGDTTTGRYFVGMGMVTSAQQPTALATVGASTTSYASFRMYAGDDPDNVNLNNGDIWYGSSDGNVKVYTQNDKRNFVNTKEQSLRNKYSIWGATVSGQNSRIRSSEYFQINDDFADNIKFKFNLYDEGTNPLTKQKVGFGSGLSIKTYVDPSGAESPHLWLIQPSITPAFTNLGEITIDANSDNFKGYIKDGNGTSTSMNFLTYFTTTNENFESSTSITTAYGGANTLANKSTFLVKPDGWIEFNFDGVRKMIPIYDPYVPS